MKNILKIAVILLTTLSIFGTGFIYVSANDIKDGDNINIGGGGNGGTERNNLLKSFGGSDDDFFGLSGGGERGIYYTLVNVAEDLKNLFFWLATLYLMIIVVRVLFADGTEDEVAKFKKGIIWITIGIIVMQAAYAIAKNLYARDIGQALAFNFIDTIVNPIIGLLEVLASVFFIGVAIFAFYRMITANGEEDKVSQGKSTIAYAIIGFILIKLAKVIVEGVYGKINCTTDVGGIISVSTTNCLDKAEASGATATVMQVINWMNGFVGLIVVIMIIYAGAQVLLSGGDEEKLKKAKSSIVYIAIGLLVLAASWLIVTFFISPEVTI